jgi:hypothetical protein
MNPRTLKLLAMIYCAKALVVGVAWILVPDLPSRAATTLRQAWAHISGPSDTTPAGPSQ